MEAPWGVKGTPLNRFLQAAILVMLVERALNPGTVIKITPILVGETNWGKSAIIMRLIPPGYREYFKEGLGLNKSSDDLTASIRGSGWSNSRR